MIGTVVGRPLIRVRETPSTMEIAADLARLGAPSGTTVLAGYQSSGRGRSGRTWNAAPWTSLLMSFVSHPERDRAELGALSLLFGLAVAETVETFTSQRASIRWPNDVLVGGRKIAGILIVSRVIPGAAHPCLITGIGLNVNTGVSDLPDKATSIALEAGPQRLDAVLTTLCERLTATLRLFDEGEDIELRDRIEARLAFRGERVTVEDGPRSVTGRLLRTAANGALIIELASGEVAQVVAGDLTRGPRPIG